MKIVAYSDFHVCNSWPLLTLDDFVSAHARLVEYCRENTPDLVLMLGDFFRMRSPKSQVRETADRMIRDLSLNARHVGILVGNHDRTSESTFAGNSFSALRVFADVMPNIQLMETPGTYRFGADAVVQALPVGFDYKDEYFQVDENRFNIFAYHGLIQGALFDPAGHVKSKSGLSMQELDQKKWDVVLCGDVHTPQMFDFKHTYGGYVGSTMRLTEADADDERGWLVVELGKGPRPSFRLVDAGGPRFRKVVLEPGKPAPAVPEGDIVLATVHGTAAQLRGITDESVQNMFPGARQVNVKRDTVLETKQLVDGISAGTTPLEDVVTFIKSTDSGLDAQSLVNKARIVAGEAVEQKGMFS